MSKNISFKVPRKGAADLTTTETGKVVIFQIGDMKIKCVIQDCGLRGVQLTHWASGQTMCNLDAVGYRRGSKYNDREACRQALGAAERRVGAGKMLAVILAAPVINR